ncbi:MAG: MFS transporter [Minwuia sp.]|uniref:MFS transporter n=1 Tax=Minwuia sp. TaxID=2493630 RepID=UPI003A8B2A07
MSDTAVGRAYALLTNDDEGRVCRDIPESACNEQPRNFMKHVVSLSATKLGDGLFDPKLVLTWLMNAIGAPVYLTGALVPLREAGALLPQLFTAAWIRSMPQRKWAWAAGSAVQGLCAAGVALTAATMEGETAGWIIVALVALFAIGRSVCSVSHKDVLGKTVSKSTRGTATGTAGSAAAIGVLAFGVLIGLGLLPLEVWTIAIALGVACGLWLFAAAVFTTLLEEPGSTGGGGNAFGVAVQQFGLLGADPQLRLFIAVRGLLVPTALAPPYLLTLSGQAASRSLGDLGFFVVASSLAAIFGGYVWGRLSDRSSRKTLIAAGALGALTLLAAAGVEAADLSGNAILLPGLLFVLVLGYQGVRLARSTHLTDMADKDSRAAYTALSNTIIGVLLLATSGLGFVASALGTLVVLLIFAAMCALASVLAFGLKEVQADDGDD